MTVNKTVGEKDNLLVAPTPPTPPVTPKSAKPVVSSEKSGPQLPETNQTNDTAWLSLGVVAVMGVAYSHRRRKNV